MSSTDQHSTERNRENFLDRLRQVLPSLTLWSRLRIQGRLRQRMDPEDLVQETCVRAYEGYDNYDAERASFRAWIFGVANHVLLHELRHVNRQSGMQNSRLGTSERNSDLDALSASQTSITSAVSRLEQLTALTSEIEELEDSDRWILIYRGLEEHGFEEVGQRLQLHPEAVRTRWRRILTKLRYSKGLVPFLDDAS